MSNQQHRRTAHRGGWDCVGLGETVLDQRVEGPVAYVVEDESAQQLLLEPGRLPEQRVDRTGPGLPRALPGDRGNRRELLLDLAQGQARRGRRWRKGLAGKRWGCPRLSGYSDARSVTMTTVSRTMKGSAMRNRAGLAVAWICCIAGSAGSVGQEAAARSNNAPKIVIGVIVVALLIGSFFLPRLRRRHRRRR